MVERKRRSHFWVFIQAKRRKRRREEIQVWNSCLKLWFGTLVFVSMESMYGFVG